MACRSRALSALLHANQVRADACAVPSRPTWSLRKLISSYPSPSLSSATFQRLHQLSALIPPKEGTPEYEATRMELDELVRLVEAVRLVDLGHPKAGSVPDGRVLARDAGIPHANEPLHEEVQRTRLLHYATQTLEDMYVVETDRVR